MDSTTAELTIQAVMARGAVFIFWWSLLALAVYAVVGQVVKPGLRLWVTRKPAPEPKDSDEAKVFKAARLRKAAIHRYVVRVLAVVLGAVGGLIPIWPDWMPLWGGVLAGLSAGTFSTTIYAIVKDRLPAWADKLGGAAVSVAESAPDPATSNTNLFDAIPAPGPDEL